MIQSGVLPKEAKRYEFEKEKRITKNYAAFLFVSFSTVQLSECCVKPHFFIRLGLDREKERERERV